MTREKVWETTTLLMQVFHGGGTEDDEEAHPERGRWNGIAS